MTIDPQKLRKDTLNTRNALSADEISKSSEAVCKTLLTLPEITRCNTFFIYVSFRSEVSTFNLIQTLITRGKTVTVPITRIKEQRLDAIKITDIATDLEPGYCNIPEPPETLCATNIVDPQEIDAILLPGSVFDKRGGRFGYGGGYYDRFVSGIPGAIRIGLAFELQVIDEIPLQPHDELLDFVVTESKVYTGKR